MFYRTYHFRLNGTRRHLVRFKYSINVKSSYFVVEILTVINWQIFSQEKGQNGLHFPNLTLEVLSSTIQNMIQSNQKIIRCISLHNVYKLKWGNANPFVNIWNHFPAAFKVEEDQSSTVDISKTKYGRDKVLYIKFT